MFGGYGLYCEGIMFALIAHATLYFKVDADNQERFTETGMGRLCTTATASL
jgi:DNA transformation protein